MNLTPEKIKKIKELNRVHIDKAYKDLGKVLSILGKDSWNGKVSSYRNASDVVWHQKAVIHSVILSDYLEMNSKFDTLILNYFFNHCQNSYEDTIKKTGAEEFKIFQVEILESMPFLRKFTIIKRFVEVPSDMKKNVEKLNDLRNAIAHHMLPEKLKDNRVIYKKKLIYNLDGLKCYHEDIIKTFDFFQNLFYEAFENNKKED